MFNFSQTMFLYQCSLCLSLFIVLFIKSENSRTLTFSTTDITTYLRSKWEELYTIFHINSKTFTHFYAVFSTGSYTAISAIHQNTIHEINYESCLSTKFTNLKRITHFHMLQNTKNSFLKWNYSPRINFAASFHWN